MSYGRVRCTRSANMVAFGPVPFTPEEIAEGWEGHLKRLKDYPEKGLPLHIYCDELMCSLMEQSAELQKLKEAPMKEAPMSEREAQLLLTARAILSDLKGWKAADKPMPPGLPESMIIILERAIKPYPPK